MNLRGVDDVCNVSDYNYDEPISFVYCYIAFFCIYLILYISSIKILKEY